MIEIATCTRCRVTVTCGPKVRRKAQRAMCMACGAEMKWARFPDLASNKQLEDQK